MSMKVLTLLLVGVVSVAGMTSCSQAGVTFKFYIIIKPEETEKFIGAVKEIAKENGMTAAAAKVVSDTGKVLNVVEARGHGVKLWAENIRLSGKEDPNICGSHFEPYPDPAQFMLFTEPRLFGSKTAAKELGERVLSQIQELGFDVRQAPVVCGAAALHERT